MNKGDDALLLEPTILSIIIAKLRKGKFKNLENIDIRAWYLLLVAASIQILSSIIKKLGFEFENIFFYLHIFSYILMMACLLLNLKKNSMKIFLIGLILNFIVIFANGGKMPVSLNGIKGINDNIGIELPIGDFDIKHIGVTQDTKLVYLADIILIPEPYPLAKILSIGDIFIMTGLFVFLQEGMVIREDNENPN